MPLYEGPELVKRLVDIPSFPHTLKRLHLPDEHYGELAIAQFLNDQLEGTDCTFRRIQEFAPGRANLLAMKGTGRKRVLWLFGHLDTVGNLQTYKQYSQDGDFGYGTGSWDMKGGVGSMFDAFRRGTPSPDESVGLFLLGDEEAHSHGYTAFSDFYKSPEGEEVIPRPNGILSAEINSRHFSLSIPIVTLGRRGHVKLHVQIRTPHEHAGMDRPSATNIWDALLARVQERLEKDFLDKGKAEEFFAWDGKAPIENWKLGLPHNKRDYSNVFVQKDPILSNAFGVNADLNIVAGESIERIHHMVREELDRVLPESDSDEYSALVVPQVDVTEYEPYFRPPVESYAMLKAVQQMFGQSLQIATDGSTSDMNKFALEFGHLDDLFFAEIGPRGKDAHNHREKVNLRSLQQTTEFYTQVVNGKLWELLHQ